MKGESQASLAWAWAELGNKLSQDFPGQVGGWLGQKKDGLRRAAYKIADNLHLLQLKK